MNKITTSLILSLLCLLPLCSIAQIDATWGYINAQQADSLKLSLQREKNDTVRMAAYRSLGFYYQDYIADSGYYYHEQQLVLAKKLNMKLWQADAYSQTGYCLATLGDLMKSYDYHSASMKLAADEKNEADNWRPWTFSNSKNSHEARISILAMNYQMMGNLWGFLGEKEKQRSHYLEGIKLGESINNGKVVFLNYGNLINLLPPDSVLLACNKALKVAEAAGYQRTGSVFLRMSRIYLDRKMFDSALVFARKSLDINKATNYQRSLGDSYSILSNLFGQQNVKDSSLYYAKKAFETAKITDLRGALLRSYIRLYSANQLYNRTDSALKYAQLSYALNDSLKNVRIDNLTKFQQFSFNEQLRLKKLDEEKTAYANNLKLLGLLAVLFGILAVALFLYRNNRQKQIANTVLQEQKNKVESTLQELKSTQSQLIQSEKMASLGELTAGIAHEIQNPLNFVNNFSELSVDLVKDLKEEIEKSPLTPDGGILISSKDKEYIEELFGDLSQNQSKINHHGKRASDIVKGMLEHSRTSTGQKEPTDINALCGDYLRLAYQGQKAKNKDFNATMETHFDPNLPKVEVIPQDIGRVLLNLMTNAFYAVNERNEDIERAVSPSGAGGKGGQPQVHDYIPTVSITTELTANSQLLIAVKDNGNGISDTIKDKIFQPFFTTKPTGQGTGLGLSLSYDIVNAHGGTLEVESVEGEGSIFIIQLPITIA